MVRSSTATVSFSVSVSVLNLVGDEWLTGRLWNLILACFLLLLFFICFFLTCLRLYQICKQGKDAWHYWHVTLSHALMMWIYTLFLGLIAFNYGRLIINTNISKNSQEINWILLCQIRTVGILVCHWIGRILMYTFFSLRSYISFESSFMAFNRKILFSYAGIQAFLMLSLLGVAIWTVNDNSTPAEDGEITYCGNDYHTETPYNFNAIFILALHILDLGAALLALAIFGYRAWRVKKIARDTDYFCLDTLENRLLYNAFRKHLLFNTCTFLGCAIVLISVILFDALAYIIICLDTCANVLYIFCMFTPNDEVYYYLCYWYASKNVSEEDWEVSDIVGSASYQMIKAASYVRKRLTQNSRDIDMIRHQMNASELNDTELTAPTETGRRVHFNDTSKEAHQIASYSTEIQLDTELVKKDSDVTSSKEPITPLPEWIEHEKVNRNVLSSNTPTTSSGNDHHALMTMGKSTSARVLNDNNPQQNFQLLAKQNGPTFASDGRLVQTTNEQRRASRRDTKESGQSNKEETEPWQMSKIEVLSRMQLIGSSRHALTKGKEKKKKKNKAIAKAIVTETAQENKKKKDKEGKEHTRVRSENQGQNLIMKPQSPNIFRSERMFQDTQNQSDILSQKRVSNSMDVEIPDLVKQVKERYQNKNTPTVNRRPTYSEDDNIHYDINEKGRSSEKINGSDINSSSTANTRNAKSALSLAVTTVQENEEIKEVDKNQEDNEHAHIRSQTGSMFFQLPAALLRFGDDDEEDEQVEKKREPRQKSDVENVMANLKRNTLKQPKPGDTNKNNNNNNNNNNENTQKNGTPKLGSLSPNNLSVQQIPNRSPPHLPSIPKEEPN